MKYSFFILLCSYWFFSNSCQFEDNHQKQPGIYSAKVFNIDANGYGYDIYRNTKIIIHQPMIPGIPGRIAFASRKSAEGVAQLIVSKLERGMMPPSVSNGELDSLGIKYK